MGAWDGSVFGNDIAADWVEDLVDDGSVETVEELLAEVVNLPATEYLDAHLGSEALAAAEVVAAATGRPMAANAYNERALDWAAKHRELSGLQSLAREAAERVRTPKSELLELWQEDDVESAARREWDDSIAALLARLQ